MNTAYQQMMADLRQEWKLASLKHKSKLHRGFEKQCARQNKKPNDVKIKLPAAIELPPKFKSKYAHHIKVSNNKWNGMNLKSLCNSFVVHRVGGMYGRFKINKDGKYILSLHGQRLLKKRRESRLRGVK